FALSQVSKTRPGAPEFCARSRMNLGPISRALSNPLSSQVLDPRKLKTFTAESFKTLASDDPKHQLPLRGRRTRECNSKAGADAGPVQLHCAGHRVDDRL